MERLGFVLLTIGFLAAAFVTSLSPTEVDWRLFAPAIAVGGIGVVMVKQARRAAARDSTVIRHHLEVLDRSLAVIVENLDRFRDESIKLPVHELRFEIDRRFRDDLRAFADARESMVYVFGMRAYGQVMSAFAAGERYLNRIWSASADEYEAEARAYIGRAHTQFLEARAAFDHASAQTFGAEDRTP